MNQKNITKVKNRQNVDTRDIAQKKIQMAKELNIIFQPRDQMTPYFINEVCNLCLYIFDKVKNQDKFSKISDNACQNVCIFLNMLQIDPKYTITKFCQEKRFKVYLDPYVQAHRRALEQKRNPNKQI